MIKISRNRKRKKRKLKKSVVIFIIVVILIIMLIMALNSLDKITDNSDEQLAELSTPDNIADDDVYQKYNCEDVSKEYIDNRLQINLKFDKELFDDESNDNEEYFVGIVNELAEKYNRDFILKDETKNIIIDVTVNSSEDYKYIINSIEDYFKQVKEENKQIREYKEIETVSANISYNDFISFNINNWSARAANVKIQEKGDDYLGYGTYKVLTNNTFINTIILNSDFKEEIIEGIKVGDSFDSIKNKLGNPIFENNNMIGYKTTDIYTFFYNDEVAIYPNEKFNNLELEDLITKYLNGKYESRSSFAYDINHTYLDFNSYIDSLNTLNIESTVRGMKIKIAENGDINIYVYNNYEITETTKKYIRENIITANLETDFVYESELKRN